MISRILCWLQLHDWGCVFHHTWDNGGGNTYGGTGNSEITGWKCHRCGIEKMEQWDG